ncbi:MAG: type II secretion system F family protein [Halobacteriales archaeon]|nr:type II secretion system F family protein [Halobacteriales archaeon]
MSTGFGGGGGADTLSDVGYPFYRRMFDSDGEFVREMAKKLSQARMPDPVEMYLSRAITLGLLVGLGLWVVGTLMGYVLFAFGVIPVSGTLVGLPTRNAALIGFVNAIKVPALIVVTGVVFGLIGFGTGFGTLVMVPYMRASTRKREINMLLPDSVSFMYALSIGGLNQLEILEAMGRASDTYGEVSREFRSIVQETEYFDTDYRTAIREQALITPSAELSQFLIDMLSIINSGGDMTSFLDDKKEKHMRTAKQQQETTLETLELFGEMYMTLSLFPLLLIIVLVIMSMLGKSNQGLLMATVYGLIPMTGIGFLVLVSTVKQDEIGDGLLDREGANVRAQTDGGVFSLGVVEAFVGEYSVFDRIRNKEGTFKTMELLKSPHLFFRDHPLYTLGITVPAVLVLIAVAIINGQAPTSAEGLVSEPVAGTVVYVYIPLYVTMVPLTVFYEWNLLSRRGIVKSLSDDLRKLSSANDTGLTLLESIGTIADTSSGKLANELEVIHKKVQYGTSLRDALIEFNNKYRIPRLARTVKLIGKAQEASSQITNVLTTAAQASENQDDIDRERKSRTRMQVVIIIMTYLTLLAVIAILKTQFLDVMAGLNEQASSAGGGTAGAGAGFGGGIDSQLLSLLFFHAVTIQAVLSGFISGYIRSANLLSGVKFVVVLSTFALGTWMVVG